MRLSYQSSRRLRRILQLTLLSTSVLLLHGCDDEPPSAIDSGSPDASLDTGVDVPPVDGGPDAVDGGGLDAAEADAATDACEMQIGVSCDAFSAGYFKADNTGQSDTFGTSVDLSEDGNLMVVGAPHEGSSTPGLDSADDDLAPDSGAVYVFARENAESEWVQEVRIKAPVVDVADRFGAVVALSGNRLAVGAPGESSSLPGQLRNNRAPLSGAVYVFVRDPSSNTWSIEDYVKPESPVVGDEFGGRLDLEGDLLAVGASNHDGPFSDRVMNSGAVFVFERSSDGDWAQEAYLRSGRNQAGSDFGISVSLAVSGGASLLAVGVPRDDSGEVGPQTDEAPLLARRVEGSGAVYVYIRDATTMPATWRLEAYIKSPDPGVNDDFGMPVALQGDLLAVSAQREASSTTGINPASNDLGPESGAVYTYRRDAAGVWTYDAFIKPPFEGSVLSPLFGSSLSISNNVLAVGAEFEGSDATGINGDGANTRATWSGAVHLFGQSADGEWSQLAYIKASNTEEYDNFGSGLALSGRWLAVGARSEDSAATGINGDESDNGAELSGAVYLRQIAP